MTHFILIEHWISVEKSSLCKQIYYSLYFTYTHTYTHTCTCVQYDIYFFQWIYVNKILIEMNCISDNTKGENNPLLNGMSLTNLKNDLDKSIWV